MAQEQATTQTFNHFLAAKEHRDGKVGVIYDIVEDNTPQKEVKPHEIKRSFAYKRAKYFPSDYKVLVSKEDAVEKPVMAKPVEVVMAKPVEKEVKDATEEVDAEKEAPKEKTEKPSPPKVKGKEASTKKK